MNEQLPKILMVLKNTIDSGMDTFKEHNQTFHNDMSDTVEDKLEEYNKTFGDLKNLIEEVMQQCQNNTESYQETLKHFTERQHDANQLAKQDLELLQKLIKR